jgi:hypothetical protein
MTQQKIKVGPLPKQAENYGHFEEEKILWGRVLAFALIVVVALGFGVKILTSSPEVEMTVPVLPAMPQVKSVTEYREPARATAESSNAALEPRQEVAEMPTQELLYEGASADSASTVADLSVERVSGEEIPVAQPLAQVISPISTYHEGMAVAALTYELKDGRPVDSLGYNIPMNDEGIIKVILFTQMNDLKGTVLFHDWYLADKRMARVKIPVNVKDQNSYSSKFINTQMLGHWTVKIVDGKGDLYAEANFSVQ